LSRHSLGPGSVKVDKCGSQYVIHPRCSEGVMIHVRERLDERDSTESFLDIGDVVSVAEIRIWRRRQCKFATPPGIP